MEKSNKGVVSESKLLQLYIGLLMLTLKKEMEEANYSVIDMMTFEHEIVQKQNRYAYDVQRVLDELKLTTELLIEVQGQKQAKHKTHEPEEIINYYNGIFLDLVHQIKDKLFRLVACLLTEEPIDRAYKEPEAIETTNFLKKHKDILEKIGIHDLLKKWRQEDDDSIGVILRRRTQHRHFLSFLQLNSDFQNVRMIRVMSQPSLTSQLTEYGKQRMTDLGEQSFKKMKEDIAQKQRRAIREIENNLNAISEKLIVYYKIPTDQVALARIGKDYIEFLASLEIVNEARKDDILPAIKSLISQLITSIQQTDDVISIYLVGSCTRRDFVPGRSDINIYIITKGTHKSLDCSFPLNVTLLSEDDFLSESHKKDRFICWSDGVLLTGKKFEFEAGDFPKPGALLCLLLNRGVVEELESLKTEISILQNPSFLQLKAYSLKIAKIMLDYDFGISISNKPFYTASCKKRITHIKKVFPHERRTLILEQVYNGSVIRHDDFPIIIDAFLENARKTYQTLLALEKKVPKK